MVDDLEFATVSECETVLSIRTQELTQKQAETDAAYATYKLLDRQLGTAKERRDHAYRMKNKALQRVDSAENRAHTNRDERSSQ